MTTPTPAQFQAQVQWVRTVGVGSRVMILAPAVRAHPYHCKVAALSGTNNQEVTFEFEQSKQSPFPDGTGFRVVVLEKRRHYTVIAAGIIGSAPAPTTPPARTINRPPMARKSKPDVSKAN